MRKPNAFAKTLVIALAAAGALATASTASAQVEVRNDGFESGGVAGFQGGFIVDEIGAARLVPSGTPPFRVDKVRLLFGGSAGTRTVTLEIYDDTAGGTNPGTMLFSADYELTASNEAFQEIDLGADNVSVPGAFRVGVKFQHSGLPSIARDDDGTINAANNFIFAGGIGWVQSNALGLTGDWIIRADVFDSGGGTPDAGTGGTPDAGTGGNPDAGTGQFCMVHSECPTGQHCADNVCTYECRVDFDCGDDMRCTSLGMCEPTGDGGGCRGAPGATGWPLAPLLLASLWLALAWVRRRA